MVQTRALEQGSSYVASDVKHPSIRAGARYREGQARIFFTIQVLLLLLVVLSPYFLSTLFRIAHGDDSSALRQHDVHRFFLWIAFVWIALEHPGHAQCHRLLHVAADSVPLRLTSMHVLAPSHVHDLQHPAIWSQFEPCILLRPHCVGPILDHPGVFLP
jgi:hypothetical protein